jgi:hypothetical protein
MSGIHFVNTDGDEWCGRGYSSLADITGEWEHVTCEGCLAAQSGYSAREIMLERSRDTALADLKVARKALEDAQERNAERVTLQERLTEQRLRVVSDALKVANTTLSALLAARDGGLPSETRGAPVNAAQDASEPHRWSWRSELIADRMARVIDQDHAEALIMDIAWKLANPGWRDPVTEDEQRRRHAQNAALADRVEFCRKYHPSYTQSAALARIVGQDHDEANAINDRLDWLRDNG